MAVKRRFAATGDARKRWNSRDFCEFRPDAMVGVDEHPGPAAVHGIGDDVSGRLFLVQDQHSRLAPPPSAVVPAATLANAARNASGLCAPDRASSPLTMKNGTPSTPFRRASSTSFKTAAKPS